MKTKEYETRHQNVDIAVFRELTEGEYSGIEHEVLIEFRYTRE